MIVSDSNEKHTGILCSKYQFSFDHDVTEMLSHISYHGIERLRNMSAMSNHVNLQAQA